MSERKAATERAVHDSGLHWSRIATLAAAVLLHLLLLGLLLAPPQAWRGFATNAAAAAPDVLRVRLLPRRPRSAEPPRAVAPRSLRQTPIAHKTQPPAPVALSSRATMQATPSPPAPRAIDSLIATAPPSYVAGGGRLSGADYGRQNVRVPGSDAPIRGMPVFRMADPRMQGLAGVIRIIGRATGAVDPHCRQLERWRGLTVQERIAQHVDADDAQMAAMADRYGCSEPLKPGAAMYYFAPRRRYVGAH